MVSALNENIIPTVTLKEASVFSSQKNFNKLKRLADTHKIRYGLSSITDINFYLKVNNLESSSGSNTYSLSISNVFDSGFYNGLTFTDIKYFLKNTFEIFNASKELPLVVFRTTNLQPPHGFLRYDIESIDQIESLAEANQQ